MFKIFKMIKNSQNLKNTQLTLIWDLGISLDLFAKLGSLRREIAIYKKLAQHLKNVNFLTYGGKRDYKYSNLIKPIKLKTIYYFPFLPQKYITILQILFFNKEYFKKTDIIKTNQIPGSEIALWAARHFHKKLLVRCGYLHVHFLKQKSYPQSVINYFTKLEKKTFTAADRIIITSSWQKQWIINQYGVKGQKIHVVPNYVLTNLFKPTNVPKKFALIFVDRGSKQKNLESLISAIHKIQKSGRILKLALVGNCCQSFPLQELIKKYNIKTTFFNCIEQKKLANILNQAKIFILPSLFEGHPKALLEAMSCGLPCIGSNVEGIKEEIKHLNNGYLCQTNPDSIANAINALLKNKTLRNSLGKNARKYCVKKYNLKKVVAKELKALSELSKNNL